MRTIRSLLAPLFVIIAALVTPLASSEAETHTINFFSYSYSPNQLTIAVGDTVEWSGQFSFHPLQQVTSASGSTPVNGGFSYNGVNPTFSQTFNSAGTFYYLCGNHGVSLGMRGSITVTSGGTPPTPTAGPTPTITPTAGPSPTPCSVVPGKPVISAPPKGTKSTAQSLTLSWDATDCATSYKVVIKKDSKSGPIFKRKNTSTTSVKTGKLPRDHSYFWSLQACNAIGCSPLANSKFTVKALKK